VARGEKIDSYKVLVGKPEGNSPTGRPMRKWKNKIQMDLQGIM
jgi:hypothetical protein